MPDVNYGPLPMALRGGMKRWIEQGVKPGGFLLAMLENNLSETVNRADPFNEVKIAPLVRWLYREAPGLCWGSPERVKEWPANLKAAQRDEGQS